MKPVLCLAGITIVATAVVAADMRTWTFEKTGKTFEAEVAGFTDNAVTLRETSSRTVSVPIAYLSKSDRLYLAGEQAKQWKTVEVLKLDASTSIGRYKKCKVQGAGTGGEIYIERLPGSVQVVLLERNRQAAPIAALSNEIDARKQAVQEAKVGVPTKNVKGRAKRREAARQRGQVNVEASNVNGLEANLAKLQKSYDESVQKTRNQTLVRMRNTGVIYKGLPLWQCFDPQKPRQ